MRSLLGHALSSAIMSIVTSFIRPSRLSTVESAHITGVTLCALPPASQMSDWF